MAHRDPLGSGLARHIASVDRTDRRAGHRARQRIAEVLGDRCLDRLHALGIAAVDHVSGRVAHLGNDVGFVAHSVAGQCGVAGRVVQCGDLALAQHHAVHLGCPAVVLRDARIIGGSDEFFGAVRDACDQVNERGIDRVLDRLLQCDRAVVVGGVILDGFGVALRGVGGPAQRRTQPEAVTQTRDSAPDLEGGRRVTRCGRPVARVRDEVRTSVQSQNPAGTDINRSQADVQIVSGRLDPVSFVVGDVVGVVNSPLHGGLGGVDGSLLHPGVHCGDDRQATAVDLLRGEALGLELAGGHLDQEPIRAAVDIAHRDVRELGKLVVVLVVLFLGDGSYRVEHAVDHVVVPL